MISDRFALLCHSTVLELVGEFKSADLYADMAIRHNRYNAKALVNKGNCLFMSKEYGRAKEIFLEAIGVEVSSCSDISPYRSRGRPRTPSKTTSKENESVVRDNLPVENRRKTGH